MCSDGKRSRKDFIFLRENGDAINAPMVRLQKVVIIPSEDGNVYPSGGSSIEGLVVPLGRWVCHMCPSGEGSRK